MVLLIDNNNYIYGRNPVMKKEDMPSGAVWYDGDFSLQYGEDKDGFQKVYKWDGSKPIVIYEPIPAPPTPEPTLDEKIYEAVSKNQDELRQEGADMMMAELVKRGLMT